MGGARGFFCKFIEVGRKEGRERREFPEGLVIEKFRAGTDERSECKAALCVHAPLDGLVIVLGPLERIKRYCSIVCVFVRLLMFADIDDLSMMLRGRDKV